MVGIVQSKLRSPEARTFLLIVGILITVIAVPHFIHSLILYHTPWNWHKPGEEASWIASSHSWVDRTLCSWAGFCGLAHIALARQRLPELPWSKLPSNPVILSMSEQQGIASSWHLPKQRFVTEAAHSNLTDIPQFVLDHAPLVHLYTEERFWPGDIAEHLQHTRPEKDYTPLTGDVAQVNLSTLDSLNKIDNGQNIFLTSLDDPETVPDWLSGRRNIPKDDGVDGRRTWGQTLMHLPKLFTKNGNDDDAAEDEEGWESVGEGDHVEDHDDPEERPNPAVPIHLPATRGRATSSTSKKGSRSTAPALLIVVPKENDVVDAFWFFFYSFNLGNTVFNTRFGNHVGDWEHTMVRFQKGVPKAVYLSEHEWGQAYTYKAIEKSGKRPVVYSASGSHAMYGVPGTHPYALPWGILKDVTDEGPLWDPAQNLRSYVYDYKEEKLRASSLGPDVPTQWFDFAGRWGDKYYPLGDKRQYRLVGEYHYVSGPEGPKFKKLGRKSVCQHLGRCSISKKLHR